MGQCLCKEKFLKSRKPSKSAVSTPKSGDAIVSAAQDRPATSGEEGQDDVSAVAATSDSGDHSGETTASPSSSVLRLHASTGKWKETNFQSRVDHLVLQMLSIIRKLVDNDNSPPMAMLVLHKYAEKENGWISIINSMVRVIPISDPLGPAVMLLLLDECPLPTKESVAEFLANWPLTKHSSQSGQDDPQTQRNLCVILSCLAEKLAGAVSTSLLMHHNDDPDLIQSSCGDGPNNRDVFATKDKAMKSFCNGGIPAHSFSASAVEARCNDPSPAELESTTLGYLLNNLSVTRDPDVVLFTLIALEKFAQTSQNKKIISNILARSKPNPLAVLELWRKDSHSSKRQVGFLAQWYLDNLFVSEGRKFTYLRIDYGSTRALLNSKDVSEYLKISADGLEARCDASSFESVRCTHPVDQGVWYYEVEVVTAGVMQIGWATKLSKFLNHEGYGIGDDETSLAYDGCRQVIWFSASSSAHCHPRWESGDILGCLLSLQPGQRYASFFLNGYKLPESYSPSLNRIFVQLEQLHGATCSSFPSFFAAASFMSFQQCVFNFGKTPFKFPPPVSFECFNDVGAMTPDDAVILPRHVVMANLMARNGLNGDAAADVEDDDGVCTLCCDDRASVTLRPCGHDGFCFSCAAQMEMCPLCRTPIESRRDAEGEGDDENDEDADENDDGDVDDRGGRSTADNKDDASGGENRKDVSATFGGANDDVIQQSSRRIVIGTWK